MINLKILFFTFLYLVSWAIAQETVLQGGEISGKQVWQGIIRIQGDITIPANAQVTIQPGTRILLGPAGDKIKGGIDKTRCEIIVRGSLIARGQPNNKIVFSSASASPRMSDWYGIQFLHNNTENVVEYCVVEYGYNGITIKNSNITVSTSEIRYNYNSGIRMEVKAAPNLMQNIISENGYAGVVCELGSKPRLTENLITGNPMGIVILSLSQPNLGSVIRDDNYNPGKNKFLNNEEYDIYNHSNKEIRAQNNTWDNVNGNAIAAKIYDNSDNGKYGAIDYEPVYNSQSRQSTLSRFMILAQNDQAPAPNVSQTVNKNQPNSGTGIAQQNTPPSTGSDILQQIDSTMENVFRNQTQTDAVPLIASANPVESKEDNTLAEVEQIDFNRIFLEPFLDTGCKMIIYKESINFNATLKNVLSPGVIRVKVVVNQQGKVESASILRGINQIMDEAVLSTVSNYVYEIGRVNGVPVRFSTNEVFRFQ